MSSKRVRKIERDNRKRRKKEAKLQKKTRAKERDLKKLRSFALYTLRRSRRTLVEPVDDLFWDMGTPCYFWERPLPKKDIDWSKEGF